MPCRQCGQSAKNHLDNCPKATRGRVDTRPVSVTKSVLARLEEEAVAAMAKEGYFLQQRRSDGDHVVLSFMLSA